MCNKYHHRLFSPLSQCEWFKITIWFLKDFFYFYKRRGKFLHFLLRRLSTIRVISKQCLNIFVFWVVLSNEDICYDYSCTTVCSLVSTVVCSVSNVAATVCCVPREPEYWWYDASCCLSRCTCTLFVLFVAL